MNNIDIDTVKTRILDSKVLNENLLDHERFRNASVNDDGRIYLTQRILGDNDTGDYKKPRTKEVQGALDPTTDLDPETLGSGKEAGAIVFNSKVGSALAFDEQELDRVLRKAKKGEKLGEGLLTTAFITSLISAAPEIIKGI